MSEIDSQRRCALAARRTLSPAERSSRSRAACQRLARLPLFRRARRIGIYWPLASEADPRFLFALRRPGQTFYLPRVHGQTLRFIAPHSERFRRHRSGLGIVEPRAGIARPVDTLDMLVMPLAGFDSGARRIGMGGGYYDRTLAPHAARHGFRRPRLVGLAFEVQRLPHIAKRAWDIDLDRLVTEAHVYRFAPEPCRLR